MFDRFRLQINLVLLTQATISLSTCAAVRWSLHRLVRVHAWELHKRFKRPRSTAFNVVSEVTSEAERIINIFREIDFA